MSEERIQITIEQELQFVRERLDYASQLLSIVVQKLGGTVELSAADLDVDINGVHIEDTDDGGFKIQTFKDE